MKIVHFITSIDRTSGGTASYMQLLARELGKLVDLHIVTRHSDNELMIENATIHYIDIGLFNICKAKRQFGNILDEIKPDVVHSNSCWKPHSSFVIFWAKAKGYKTVLTPHGMLEPWIMRRHYWTRKWPALMLYQRKSIKTVDIIHATAGSEMKNLTIDSRLSIHSSRVVVIPNGVNIDGIEIKQSWKRKKNILFLSRVHPKKGINFLIEAAVIMKDELQGYTFTIAGESFGNYIEELKQLVTNKGVAEMFKFIGGVYGDEKWHLYKEADLFVLPTHSENFGIVVAEALATGTPVITTKGAPWSDLEEYKCGWWTEIGTQSTIAALRQFLVLAENELEKMGRNGRKLIKDKYSAKSMSEKFIKMYENLINR